MVAVRVTAALLAVFMALSCGSPGMAGDLQDQVDGWADISPDPDSSSDGSLPDESFGFSVRTPGTHSMGLYGEVLEVDYVCTFVWQDISAYLYVQSTPIECHGVGGCDCTTDGAWLSVDGEVTPVDATYGWGGSHNNDWIRFSFRERVFKYHHSSIGFGWRACQPPDCLQVYSVEGALLEDGCEPERTLPVVCERVGIDGTFAPLVDDFVPCPGDVPAY